MSTPCSSPFEKSSIFPHFPVERLFFVTFSSVFSSHRWVIFPSNSSSPDVLWFHQESQTSNAFFLFAFHSNLHHSSKTVTISIEKQSGTHTQNREKHGAFSLSSSSRLLSWHHFRLLIRRDSEILIYNPATSFSHAMIVMSVYCHP